MLIINLWLQLAAHLCGVRVLMKITGSAYLMCLVMFLISFFRSSTEVKLKWDLDCKAEAAQPKAFNISYCIAAENAEECSEPG